MSADPDLVSTLAFCWRLERGDGLCFGFTNHDRDLEIEGLRYRSAPGMLPSAVSLTDGFDADGLDVAGALTSDAIRGADLAAGRWDGASVELFAVDWEQPDAEPVRIARGALGDVALQGEAFEAELRGPAALLEAPVVEQTSPGCRASLGDKRCRVDLAGRVRSARISEILSDTAFAVDAAEPEPNAYGYGRIRWIGGANSGLASDILFSDGHLLKLREEPAFAPSPGDLVEIGEGCDRRFETCRARFGNAENFRGEPHLPGMDLLTRYPGG